VATIDAKAHKSALDFPVYYNDSFKAGVSGAGKCISTYNYSKT
jgi:hypothetical protein